MKIHEYQARQLLADAGIPVPGGRMVERAEDAAREAREQLASGAGIVVVKAQVHAGGRGKAGFVKVCKAADEAEAAARFMLSNRMHSPQTPPEGLEVRRLLVAAGVDIAKEYYLAIVTDRARRTNTLIASAEGGVDIEHVAATRPEAIVKVALDPLCGLAAYQARETAFRLGFKGKQVAQAADVMMRLAGLFLAKDASLAEINPLVVTPPSAAHPDGQVIAIDAKFNFDDNAMFRHPDLRAMFDPSEENPAEMKAREFELNYVALDGNIGCLVNGAGLAMATMDTIKLFGGEPANFLDVGGGATAEKVTEAFKIMLGNPKVKGILVNIFGGIMRCDTIAEGVIAACKAVNLTVPLVVRMKGTNEDIGKKMLAESGLPIISADTMAEAATKIVAAVK